MTIGADYPSPVTVNGYSCKNCTEVDLAKKHIDPAHPKDGPYGIDKTDVTGATGAKAKYAEVSAGPGVAREATPAVIFGGQLTAPPPATAAAASRPFQLDVSA